MKTISKSQRKSGIYKIVNTVNGKIYIGSSVFIYKRWNEHKNYLRKNAHHSLYLQRAWEKYGEVSFSFETIEECDPDHKILQEREQYYFDLLKPEYNILKHAFSSKGHSPSVETRAKISQAARNISDETREKMAAAKRGRVFPKETRDLMSAAKIGKSKTPEEIAKMQATKSAARNAQLRAAPRVEKKGWSVKSRQILSENIVRDIRISDASDSALSRTYNCSAKTIGRIRRWEIYKDVL
jgi:group I intron endonuclease